MSDNIFHHPATGKGDAPRKTNKRAFDRNYLRLYGKPCPDCRTHGTVGVPDDKGFMTSEKCSACDGLGYVEKRRH